MVKLLCVLAEVAKVLALNSAEAAAEAAGEAAAESGTGSCASSERAAGLVF